MFCPECSAEYPKGTTYCLECGVKLREDLHGIKKGILFIQVMELKKSVDVTLVKRVLNSSGIQHYIQGEYLNSIEPDEYPAILMVQSDRLNETINLLSRTRIGSGNLDGESSRI